MRISTSMTSLRLNFLETVFVPLITESLSLAQAQWNSTPAIVTIGNVTTKARHLVKASLQMLCAPFAGSDRNQHIRRRRWLRLDRMLLSLR